MVYAPTVPVYSIEEQLIYPKLSLFTDNSKNYYATRAGFEPKHYEPIKCDWSASEDAFWDQCNSDWCDFVQEYEESKHLDTSIKTEYTGQNPFKEPMPGSEFPFLREVRIWAREFNTKTDGLFEHEGSSYMMHLTDHDTIAFDCPEEGDKPELTREEFKERFFCWLYSKGTEEPSDKKISEIFGKEKTDSFYNYKPTYKPRRPRKRPNFTEEEQKLLDEIGKLFE